MLETVKALTSEYDMLPQGERVLCALSGGADSMCLLHLLTQLGREEGFHVYAAHYNHHLRGEESERDAAFVAQWCEQHHIPCTIGEGDVAGQAAQLGQGIEETARHMRYAFLEDTARRLGCSRIATAHNADDNLETLLLHLTRGAGLHGLAGIPPRRGAIVRPLLTTSREEIGAYLERHGIAHVEDSTNTDEGYARNKLRSQVVPVLRQLNPRVIERSAETMAYLRADNDFLNAQAAMACSHARWAEDDLVIEARYIADLPAAIAPRAVRRLMELTGDGNTDCSAAHLNAIADLARGDDPSAVVFLPNGRLAQRVYQELLITTQQAPAALETTPLVLEGDTAPAGTEWRCSCRTVICPLPEERREGACYLNPEQTEGVPVLRQRQTGDELALPGRDTKTLKKLMIEHKIPRRDRERIPVLADEGGVLAVAGFGPHRARMASPGQPAWEVVFWKER